MKRVGYSIGIIVLTIHIMTFPLQAQEEKEKEKGIVRLDLTYNQLNGDIPMLKTSAKTKIGKKFQPTEDVEINLFFIEETAQGFMGRVRTKSTGTASLILPDKFKTKWDSLPMVKFIATVTDNEQFEDELVEIEITKARIDLTLSEEDSVRTIHAKVLAFQDSSWVDVPETEIKFVVTRLLSDLSAGEEESYTTDEAGEASAEFNMIIPGDSAGNIIVGAKIEDHELYGNLMTTKVLKWGVPLKHDGSFAKRTLFATRDKTPLWLLIFPNLIIAFVWGAILYLIYQITRIIKLGRTNKSV